MSDNWKTMLENKKSRLDFVYEQFNKTIEKSIKKDKLLNIKNIELVNKFIPNLSNTGINSERDANLNDEYFDISFAYFVNTNSDIWCTGETFKDQLWNYFLQFDPSPNKEYIQWFVNLYSDLCKDRPQITRDNKTGDKFSDKTIRKETLFFEDFGKIAEALETFMFLKKTNVLSTSQKDINQYKTYHDFVNTIKPYAPGDDDDDNENVHTLTHSEIKSIQNYVDLKTKNANSYKNAGIPLTELCFENKEWVVVITHNRESNKILGKNTTWCTAGTRYSDMFHSYYDKGPLFVLIKKGFGSKKHINKDASVRLQFHFETGNYMDANDRPINIQDFLNKNPEIKLYLANHIIKVVSDMGKVDRTGTQKVVEFLTKLGYAEELIGILVKSQPEKLELVDFNLTEENVKEIGKITALKQLLLNNCNVCEIPESFTNLKNLKELSIIHDKKLKHIPDFISSLTNLVKIDFSNCNIQNNFDLLGLDNLEELNLDNNRELSQIPKNIDKCKKLCRLSLSKCDLKNLDDSILNLKRLFMLDLHYNKNLTHIPEKLTSLPELIACNLDNTNLPNHLKTALRDNATYKKEKCTVVIYD